MTKIMVSRGDHSTAARAAFVALLALAGVELFGFFGGHLWRQEIWYADGIARFRFYTALFIGVATPVVVLAPWLVAPLTVVFVAAATIHAIGWAATLAPLLFLISSWSLGSLLVRKKQKTIESALIATLLGAGVYVLLMTLTARLPVHYWWVWLALLVAPLP